MNIFPFLDIYLLCKQIDPMPFLFLTSNTEHTTRVLHSFVAMSLLLPSLAYSLLYSAYSMSMLRYAAITVEYIFRCADFDHHLYFIFA